MTMTEVPKQYVFLFRFLREWSGAYTAELAKLAEDSKAKWNPRTARFEVDAYFTFLLSCSLLHLKHNRQVWEQMCNLCEAALTQVHEEHIATDDLSDVLIARIDNYGEIANRSCQSGDAPTMAWVKSLRQHIIASSHEDRVEAEHPFVIGDAFEEFSLIFAYLRIDLCFAGAFSCGLKHIFQNTSDIRTLSEEQMNCLAQTGERENVANATRTLDSMTNGSGKQSRPKRWWQFWR